MNEGIIFFANAQAYDMQEESPQMSNTTETSSPHVETDVSRHARADFLRGSGRERNGKERKMALA